MGLKIRLKPQSVNTKIALGPAEGYWLLASYTSMFLPTCLFVSMYHGLLRIYFAHL